MRNRMKWRRKPGAARESVRGDTPARLEASPGLPRRANGTAPWPPPVAAPAGASRQRLSVALRFAGMIGLPLLTLTVYLHWWWPEPLAGPFWLELVPYAGSLALGAPFAVSLARRTRLALIWSLVYLIVGAWVMEFYSIFYLCAVRDMCL